MDVTLPQLAEGADSGTVVSIMVSEGDTVENDQTIIELENEKAIAPIPSTGAGKVTKIHVSEGDTVSVGQKLITIDEGNGSGSSDDSDQASSQTDSKSDSQEADTQERGGGQQSTAHDTPQYGGQSVADPVFGYKYESKSGFPPPASPSIRQLARKIGLDLSNVRGSGKGGRILLEDVQNYIKRLHELAFQNKDSGTGDKPQSPTKKKPPEDFAKWGDVKRDKISSIRKTIGRRMQESWNEVPHVYQFDEADITNMMDTRKKHKDQYKAQGGNLTLTALAIKAVLPALKEFPIFNASLDESSDEIVYKQYYHIGIAVDTEAGLVVPVIRDVDKKSLMQISQELQEIAEKSRDRKLSNEDMKGSSFTISNLGGIGGTHFTPIVNPPNTAILGIGKGLSRPAYINGELKPRTFMQICVSYDHRVIDGAVGARFITEMVKSFENFKESDIKLSK